MEPREVLGVTKQALLILLMFVLLIPVIYSLLPPPWICEGCPPPDETSGSGTNTPPQVDFTFTVSGLTVEFHNNTSDPDGDELTYKWDFGDFHTSTLENPVHRYSSPGTYAVTLEASDGTDSNSIQKYVTVSCPYVECADQCCSAHQFCNAQSQCETLMLDVDFSFTPSSPQAGMRVTFIPDVNTNGTVSAWLWNFGDGDDVNGTGPSVPQVTHTYNQPGSYQVTLMVEVEAPGNPNVTRTDTATHQINIQAADVVASFTYSPQAPSVGVPIQFTDRSYATDNLQITAWHWDFGDGNISTQQNPTHTYAVAGTYTVSLTVTASDGNTASTSQQLEVTSNKPPTAVINKIRWPPNDTLYTTDPDKTVLLDAAGSEDPEGEPLTFSWHMVYESPTGSNVSVTTVSGSSFSFDFTDRDLGTYVITLTATDPLGSSGEASVTLHYVGSGSSPQADFTYTPAAPMPGESVFFTSTSTDPDNDIAYCVWLIENDVLRGCDSKEWVFNSAGIYSVTLTVYDEQGHRDSATKEINVGNVIPPGTLSVRIVEPQEGATVKQQTLKARAEVVGEATMVIFELDGISSSNTIDRDGSDGYAATFNLSHLSPGTSHTLKATAINTATNSSASHTINFTYYPSTGGGDEHTGPPPSPPESSTKTGPLSFQELAQYSCNVPVVQGIKVFVKDANGELTLSPTNEVEEGLVILEADAYDVDGNPLYFEWDFGDGSSKRTVYGNSRVQHTYLLPKGKLFSTYTVKVRVTDGVSGTVDANITLEVYRSSLKINVISPQLDKPIKKGSTVRFTVKVLDLSNVVVEKENIMGSGPTLQMPYLQQTVILDEYDGGAGTYSAEIIIPHAIPGNSVDVNISVGAKVNGEEERAYAFLTLPLENTEFIVENPFKDKVFYLGNLIDTIELYIHTPDTNLPAKDLKQLKVELLDTVQNTRRELSFVPSPRGEGLYLWHDKDNPIELNENVLVSPPVLTVSGADPYGNKIRKDTLFPIVVKAEDERFTVELVYPDPRIHNVLNYGQTITFKAHVVSKYEYLKPANIIVYGFFDGNELRFKYNPSSGLYEAAYTLPDVNSGVKTFNLTLKAVSVKTTKQRHMAVRSYVFPLTTEISIELIYPAKGLSFYRLFDPNRIEARLLYKTGDVLELPEVESVVVLDGKEERVRFTFQPKTKTYAARTTRALGMGEHTINVNLQSPLTGNTLVKTMIFDPMILVYLLIIIAVAYYIIARLRERAKTIEQLIQKRQQLKDMLNQLKIEYYKRHITEAEYKDKVLKVENELRTIDKLLEEKKKIRKVLEQERKKKRLAKQ
jgi:PKD repeat protein